MRRAVVRGSRFPRSGAALSHRGGAGAGDGGGASRAAGFELLFDGVEHLVDGARPFCNVAPAPGLEIGAALDEPLRHRAAVDLLLEPRAELPRHGGPVLGERFHERRDVLPVEHLVARHVLRPVLDELVAEASLDAEIPECYVVVVRRRHFHDRVVLYVQRQVAADAAVGADRVHLRLARLVPRSVAPHLEFAHGHQRARGTDCDAVAAVDARRLRQFDVVLGGDVRAEAAARDRDRERVLMVVAARLDALVTEDALRVVADVEIVVDLHGLRDRERVRAEAIGLRVVLLDVAQRVRRGREVDGRAEQLEYQAAARLHALRVRVHDHPCLDLARARRYERARPLDLDDADAADVHRVQRVAVAERRRLDAEPAAGIEDRRALGDAHGFAVDGQLDESFRCGDADGGHWAGTPRFIIADSTALAAVWPRPQIEASRMTWLRSASTASSFPFALPAASRCRAASWRTVPTRHGTHWPHDSSRKNSAMRRTASTRSAVSS